VPCATRRLFLRSARRLRRLARILSPPASELGVRRRSTGQLVRGWLMMRPSFPSRSSPPRRALARRPSTLWREMVATPSSYWCLVVRRPAGLCQITSLLCCHSSCPRVLLSAYSQPAGFPSDFRSGVAGVIKTCPALPGDSSSGVKSRSFLPVLTFLFIVATGARSRPDQLVHHR
jgi:hypothetical protein